MVTNRKFNKGMKINTHINQSIRVGLCKRAQFASAVSGRNVYSRKEPLLFGMTGNFTAPNLPVRCAHLVHE
jgi:hypothetical protein